MGARTVSSGQIVSTYVKTLFSLASEENKLAEINEDFKKLEEKFRVNSDMAKSILYPASRTKEHECALAALTQNLLPLSKNFMGVLDRYKRLNLLFPIIQGYRRYLEEHAGFLSVLVESCVSLKETEKTFLKTYLKEKTGKNVILTLTENPELLGGFRMQIHSILIDCSLKTKINELEKKLEGK